MTTKEGFLRFEEVRVSGKTNMFDKNRVCKLADLFEETYFDIIKNYKIYAKKWLK